MKFGKQGTGSASRLQGINRLADAKNAELDRRIEYDARKRKVRKRWIESAKGST